MNIDVKHPVNFEWIKPKPVQTTLGVGIPYYKLFHAIKSTFKNCYMFESLSLPRHQDRFYTIGFSPAVEFIAKGDELRIRGERRVLSLMFNVETDEELIITGINPYEYIKDNVPLNFNSKTHQGGLIGYFCYESINYFEPAISLPESDDYNNFHVGLYLDGFIYNSTTDELYYYTFDNDRSDEVKNLLPNLDSYKIPEKLTKAEKLGHSISKEDHTKSVEDMLEHIRAGNTFQGEVGFKTNYILEGDKITIYNKLREINPSPYMFYVKFDDIELIGASPEIIVANTNGSVLTTPTAGTIGRGKTDPEDKALARTLLNDPKEIAEHNMLVDLHRNDISRVCDVGSVKVRELMYIIKFSHVQHIVSDISGELRKDKTAYDLLASIAPGGVLTGAPKIETIKIIHEAEKVPRGPYGGAIGRFSMNGDSAFCLPIRGLFCKGDKCFAQTCSGVVYDSVPEKEYKEVINKLAAMENTINECSPANGN